MLETMDTCAVTVGDGLTWIGLWILALILALIVSYLRDQWRYSTVVQAMKCRYWGHDYYGKASTPATGLVFIRDGLRYHYDFCQRCRTMQNVRPEGGKLKKDLTQIGSDV